MDKTNGMRFAFHRKYLRSQGDLISSLDILEFPIIYQFLWNSLLRLKLRSLGYDTIDFNCIIIKVDTYLKNTMQEMLNRVYFFV